MSDEEIIEELTYKLDMTEHQYFELMDKYNKQKEEITKLTIQLKTQKGFSYFAHQRIMEDYISKDKIKEKIKEIGSETQYLLNDKGETKQNYAIRKFYELLEENK